MFGNCFGYFSKNWVIFSKSSGHPVTDKSVRLLISAKSFQPIRAVNTRGLYRENLRGKYQCTVDHLFDWFGISCMTTDNFLIQNRLIQTSQAGGQWYSILPPLVFPSLYRNKLECLPLPCTHLSLTFVSKARSLPLEWSHLRYSPLVESSLVANIVLRWKRMAVVNTLAYLIRIKK